MSIEVENDCKKDVDVWNSDILEMEFKISNLNKDNTLEQKKELFAKLRVLKENLNSVLAQKDPRYINLISKSDYYDVVQELGYIITGHASFTQVFRIKQLIDARLLCAYLDTNKIYHSDIGKVSDKSGIVRYYVYIFDGFSIYNSSECNYLVL